MKALLEALQPGEKDWDLAQAIDPARLPAHIAIIMDGNGRWAGRRFLPRVAGHKAGIGPVRTAVETCARLGVKALTLYAFSVENWKRPRAEVETLWRLLRYYLKQELPELQKNDIRLQAIGRLDALPPQVRRELDSAVDATSANRGLLVNLAINYGGRAEIVDAVNSILEMARLDGSIETLKIDEESDRHLPVHRLLPRSRSADPHFRRNAHQQLSALADRLRRTLRDRDALAGFHAHGPVAGRVGIPEARPPVWRPQRRRCRRRCQARRGIPDRSAPLLMKRVLTALALIPIVGWVVLWANSWIFLAVLVTVACLCYREYNDIAAGYGFGAPGVVGYGAGLLVLVWWDVPWLALVGITIVVLVMVMREEDLAHALPRAALLLTGIVYVFGCWKCARPLRELNPHWLMYGLMLNWVGDIGAYYVGRPFGKHKLAPRVSPKKSWEGSIASVFTSASGGHTLPAALSSRRALVAGGRAYRRRQHRRTVRRPRRIRHEARRERQGQRRHPARPRRLPGPRGQHALRAPRRLRIPQAGVDGSFDLPDRENFPYPCNPHQYSPVHSSRNALILRRWHAICTKACQQRRY